MSDQQSEPHLLFEHDGHVAILTMNRPEAKNALSGEMLVRMYDGWVEVDENPDIRVCILQGSGGTFCSGMDLKAFANDTQGQDNPFQKRFEEDSDLHWKALLRHFRPNKPIIAAVEGFALAGGTEILQGTDIRVAGETAVFGITEVIARPVPARRFDGAPAPPDPVHAGGGTAVDRSAGTRGGGEGDRPHRSRRARRQGAREGEEIAEQIAANAPLSVQAVLRSLREGAEMTEADALAHELELGWPIFATKDAKEGARAFAEKRPANFLGE